MDGDLRDYEGIICSIHVIPMERINDFMKSCNTNYAIVTHMQYVVL